MPGKLVGNAFKYGGSAELSCRFHCGEAVIAVRDHGSGMPPDLIARAFEPIVRGPVTVLRAAPPSAS